ncbi:hypothetical protein ACFQ0R_03050 [Psychroflexus salinarum]|uniref:PKD/Chitinase domain-containing protein n=1 Tax=Psychroflexus salinarum TaxID=546024 RepID=A0ABW3GLS1_9FLAO
MNKQFYILWLCVISVFTVSCSDDDGLQEVSMGAPTNLDAKITMTQDNSGVVSFQPTAENATAFLLNYGDGTPVSDTIAPGESLSHSYEEGTYDVTIIASNISGRTEELAKPLEVSFNPPSNLVVTVENDGVQSNTVNVTASADFASSFDVDFGEDGVDSVINGGIGETVTYTYQQPGIYTITVVAMGASSETATYTEEDFEVTEVLIPVVAAPVPTRPEQNVIAIYSDKYTPITTTEFPTSWSDTGFEEIQVEGDNIIKYTELAFTGIVTDYENPTDLTGMDFIHFDYWTTDATDLGFKIVNTTTDPVQEDIVNIGTPVQGEWVSVDIPLSDYDLDRSQITQLLFDTLGSRATVFIDNLYFYTDAPTEPIVPAPVPSVPEENVISIYSDTYTSITVTELPTTWSGSIYEEVSIDGNNAMLFTNFDFLGIVTDYENPTDLTGMTHVHFDYWSPNAESLGLKLVNTTLDPVQEDLEDVGNVALGEWVSVDIQLSNFDMDLSAVTQLIFDNLELEDADDTVYIDNFYFYN